MTYYDVYIARADDPAYTNEHGRDRNVGNFPEALSPVIYDRECFHRICSMAGHGEVLGMQADWGCWVAVVNGKQAREFFKGVSIPDDMAEFLESVQGDKLYALVALET